MPEEISSCRDTLGHIRAAVSTAGQSASPQLKNRSVTTAAVFIPRPTERESVVQGLFCGSGRRAVAHTRPAFPKNTYGLVGIPLIRGASGAGRLTQPYRREVKPGERPSEAEGNYPAAKTHSARSVPAASMAGRNATQQLEKHSVTTAAAEFVDRPT